MKTIIKIGYRSYILPPKANVNEIIANLAGAVEAAVSYHEGNHYYAPEEAVTIEFAIVEDRFVAKKPKKSLPEKASPDCHGKDITNTEADLL